MRYETNCDNLTVQNTESGYLSKMMLKGKTLVNLGGRVSGNYNKYTVVLDSMRLLNPNSEYTFIITNKARHDVVLYINEVIFNNQPSFTVKANSTNIVKCSTKDIVNQLAVLKSSSADGTIISLDVTLLEGDHTQNPPNYFEGLKSVGDGTDKIVVSSVNENLFDESKVLYNKSINSSNGDLGTAIDWCVNTDYIRVGNNEKYYLDRGNSISNSTSAPKYIYVYQYNKDKSLFNRLEVGTTSNIFTTSVDGFIRITAKYNELIDFGVYRKQGVCVSHKADKKQLLYLDPQDNTWKKPTLREWGTVEKHSDGKYYYHKRSGEVVLDGSEDLSLDNSAIKTNTILFSMTFPSDSKNKEISICNNFKFKDVYSIDEEAHYVTSSGLRIRILKTKLETQDVAGFKKWLQANNVTVVYQLAQEEVYECTPISVASYEGDTIYQIESGAISPTSSFELDYTFNNVVARVLDAKVFNRAMTDNLRQNLINKGVEVTSEDKMSSLIDKVRNIHIGDFSFGDRIPLLSFIMDSTMVVKHQSSIAGSRGRPVIKGMLFHDTTKKQFVHFKEDGSVANIIVGDVLGSFSVSNSKDTVYYVVKNSNSEIELNILNMNDYNTSKHILQSAITGVSDMDIYEKNNELYLFAPGKAQRYNLDNLQFVSTVILSDTNAQICEVSKGYFFTGTKYSNRASVYNKVDGSFRFATNDSATGIHKEKDIIVSYSFVSSPRGLIITSINGGPNITIAQSDNYNRYLTICNEYICYSGNHYYLYNLDGTIVKDGHSITPGYARGYWLTDNLFECGNDLNGTKVLQQEYGYVKKYK